MSMAGWGSGSVGRRKGHLVFSQHICLSQDPTLSDLSSVLFKKLFLEVKPTYRKVHESHTHSSKKFSDKANTHMNPAPSLRKRINTCGHFQPPPSPQSDHYPDF